MSGKRGAMRERILGEVRAIMAEGNFTAMTFDQIAERLGVTKQAVLYWFRTKQDLVREIALPGIRAEADVTIAAVRETNSAAEAIDRFVRALIAHHLSDLPRFRVMYLVPQTTDRADLLMPKQTVLEQIYPETARMYRALEIALASDPSFPADRNARQTAVAIHAAALGLVMMLSMVAAIGDSMAHPTEDLVNALVAQLSAGLA